MSNGKTCFYLACLL